MSDTYTYMAKCENFAVINKGFAVPPEEMMNGVHCAFSAESHTVLCIRIRLAVCGKCEFPISFSQYEYVEEPTMLPCCLPLRRPL